MSRSAGGGLALQEVAQFADFFAKLLNLFLQFTDRALQLHRCSTTETCHAPATKTRQAPKTSAAPLACALRTTFFGLFLHHFLGFRLELFGLRQQGLRLLIEANFLELGCRLRQCFGL